MFTVTVTMKLKHNKYKAIVITNVAWRDELLPDNYSRILVNPFTPRVYYGDMYCSSIKVCGLNPMFK